MKKLASVLAGLFLVGSAYAAEPVTTISMKCAKTPPAGYLKALANSISLETVNRFTEAGFTDLRVRVGFKSTLRDSDPKELQTTEVLQGLSVSYDTAESGGTVTIEGTKGSFADDCNYDVKANVSVAGKNAGGTKVVKRTQSSIVITAPRVANTRR
jgi:hypothetical protein